MGKNNAINLLFPLEASTRLLFKIHIILSYGFIYILLHFLIYRVVSRTKLIVKIIFGSTLYYYIL